MKSFTLVLALAATVGTVTTSSGQSYLYGAPPGGIGTYAPAPYGNADDPRFRENNWRNSSPDNWRDNNWREDRGGWRRNNNWREDRADDWRPYNLRNGQEKEDLTKKKKDETSDDNLNGDDCGMTRNRSHSNSIAPCRRQ